MAAESEALCQACGLCCDGSLFTHVALSAQEAQRLSRLQQLELEVRGDGPVLLQPCGALKGTLCTQYDQRPQGCRKFDCLLLRAVQAGEEDLAGARALIQRARALRSSKDPSTQAFLRRHFLGRSGPP